MLYLIALMFCLNYLYWYLGPFSKTSDHNFEKIDVNIDALMIISPIVETCSSLKKDSCCNIIDLCIEISARDYTGCTHSKVFKVYLSMCNYVQIFPLCVSLFTFVHLYY